MNCPDNEFAKRWLESHDQLNYNSAEEVADHFARALLAQRPPASEQTKQWRRAGRYALINECQSNMTQMAEMLIAAADACDQKDAELQRVYAANTENARLYQVADDDNDKLRDVQNQYNRALHDTQSAIAHLSDENDKLRELLATTQGEIIRYLNSTDFDAQEILDKLVGVIDAALKEKP